jgi:hypothetical protein
MLCIAGVMTPMVARAQETSNKSISQLREEIRKLEAVANDPSATAEVKELNQTFITGRRESLRSLLRLRIDALQKYGAAVKDTLTPGERDVLVSSLRDLENLLTALGGDGRGGGSHATDGTPQSVEIASLTGIPVSYKNASSTPSSRPATVTTGMTQMFGNAASGGNFGGTPPRVEPEPPVPVQSPTPKPDVTVDVATEQFSGDKVRGPSTIQLKNLNVLRYDIRVGRDVTFPPGPDLKLPFIPPLPEQPKKDNKGSGGAAIALVDSHADVKCMTIPDCFNEAVGKLNDIERDKAVNVNQEIDAVSGEVNRVKSDLEALVSASDSILATAGANTLITNVNALLGPAPAGAVTIDDALNAQWPDARIEDLIGRLNVLRNMLTALPTMPAGGGPDFSTWLNQDPTNKTAYEGTLARVMELQTQLSGLKSTNGSNAAGVAFRDAKNKLGLWKPILVGVRDGGAASFSRTFKVGCGFAFDSNKETKVKVVKRDRLADATAVPTSEEVVNVVCSSPLSVSAGFGFSNINEREFVFVPSTKTVTDANGQTSQTVINRFGFRNNSSFRTLPVLLLNTRIWEPNDTFALHISTGAAVDIKTGQGGTDLEYIVGPSISFWRSFFITPGLHIGRVPKLAGGFALDQEVPTGVSEPPLEKAWKKGFVTTFTYKIR